MILGQAVATATDIGCYVVRDVAGTISHMELPCNADKVNRFYAAVPNVPFVQIAFPELSAEEREFIITGITPEMWDTMFRSA